MRESDTAAGVETVETAECRPEPVVFWFGFFTVLVTVGMSVLLFLTTRSDTRPMMVGVAILGGAELLALTVAGVYSLLSSVRTRIVADVDGLRWRGVFHGWRSASWAQVSDYYLDKSARSTVGTTQTASPVLSPTPNIVTANGTIKTTHDLRDFDNLRRVVQARATAARVSQWDVLGTRRVDDWPQTFRYHAPGDAARFAKGTSVTVLIYAAIGYGFVRLADFITHTPYVSGLPLVYGVLLAGYLALIAVPSARVWAYYEGYTRRAESITTTPETICYTNTATGETREAAWGNVSDYFFRPVSSQSRTRYVLTLPGADEPEIAWSGLLQNGQHLLAIVQKYAPAPGSTNGQTPFVNWRDKSVHEKTGGSDPATWQGGAVGMGGRVFRNRSATNFWGWVGLTVFSMFLTCLCIGEWLQPGVKDGRWLALGTTAMFVLPTLWGWLCYLKTRVETDDMGITQHTPFSKKYLPWFAVADYKDGLWKGGTDPITVTGQNGVRITIWSTLNGVAELRGEMERYAPPPRTGWRTAAK